MARRRACSWVLVEPDPISRLRLFCFPFAGVGAAAFRDWPSRIGSAEVCPVQLPGRENRMREPSYTDFDTFAKDTAAGLLPYLDRPYAFFGHCMGALLAHAVVEELAEAGGPAPQRLFVSSCYAPCLGVSKPFHPAMTDDQLADELRRIADRLGQPEPLPELLELSVLLLRADIDMAFGYAPPVTPLSCPISVLGWRADTIVPADEMTEWSQYAEVTEHLLDGDFFDFLHAPQQLRDVITSDLHQE